MGGKGIIGQCSCGGAADPQHFLNFLPDPHGQGSLRPIFADRFGSRRGKPEPGERQEAAINCSVAGSWSRIVYRLPGSSLHVDAGQKTVGPFLAGQRHTEVVDDRLVAMLFQCLMSRVNT